MQVAFLFNGNSAFAVGRICAVRGGFYAGSGRSFTIYTIYSCHYHFWHQTNSYFHFQLAKLTSSCIAPMRWVCYLPIATEMTTTSTSSRRDLYRCSTCCIHYHHVCMYENIQVLQCYYYPRDDAQSVVVAINDVVVTDLQLDNSENPVAYFLLLRTPLQLLLLLPTPLSPILWHKLH